MSPTLSPKWHQNSIKMAPKSSQDGSKMASWRVLGPFWGQDGPKMEPSGFQGRKTQFVPPYVGAQVRTPFSTFSAPGWFTRGLETHLDDMLCPDTKF